MEVEWYENIFGFKNTRYNLKGSEEIGFFIVGIRLYSFIGEKCEY